MKKQLVFFEQQSKILSTELEYRIIVGDDNEIKHINEKRFRLINSPSISYRLIRDISDSN